MSCQRNLADKTLLEDSFAEDPVQTVISEDTEQVITELTPIEDKAQVQANTKPTAPPPDEEKQGRLPKCDMLPNAQTSVPESTPGRKPSEIFRKCFPGTGRTGLRSCFRLDCSIHFQGRLLTMMEISISR